MAFVNFNANPEKKMVDDCTVRALSVALDIDWESAYVGLALQGFIDANMPDQKSVWGNYLKSKGFKRHTLPDTCPDCYTIIDFTRDYPQGIFIVATYDHVVAVVNGDYYDTWDSGYKIPIYYWCKDENKKETEVTNNVK